MHNISLKRHFEKTPKLHKTIGIFSDEWCAGAYIVHIPIAAQKLSDADCLDLETTAVHGFRNMRYKMNE